MAVQLRAALAKPLQDSFRASFQGTIIPAFEGACQTMFSQVLPLQGSTFFHKSSISVTGTVLDHSWVVVPIAWNQESTV